jgi:hypothetical protein
MDGFNNGTRTITEDSLYRNDIGGTMAVAPQAALSGTERPSMPPAETLDAIRSILTNEGSGITQDAGAIQMANDTYNQMKHQLIKMGGFSSEEILPMSIDQVFQLYNQTFGGATGNEDQFGISMNQGAVPMNQGVMPGMNVPNLVGRRLG